MKRWPDLCNTQAGPFNFYRAYTLFFYGKKGILYVGDSGEKQTYFFMRRIFFLSFWLLLAVSLMPGLAQAAVTCPTGYDGSSGICIPTQTGLSQASVSYILETFMKWLLGIFGFLAIIAFVISGVQYLSAAGDESQAETAKRNMQYSIIGVAVALSGFIILTAIDALLQGSSTTF